MLKDIFTEEECAYLYKNEVRKDKQITWDMLKERTFILYPLSGMGKQLLEIFQDKDAQPRWIIDKNQAGTIYNTIEVKDAQSLALVDEEYVLIASIHSKEEIKAICSSYNIKNVIDVSALPEATPGHFGTYNFIDELNTNPNYKILYSLVADEESRNVLKDIFSFRITHNEKHFEKYSSEDHYFPKNLKEKFDYSVFCDCGAFDGDTFLSWINTKEIKHKKYIGIEAAKTNFNMLKETVLPYTEIEKELHYCALGKEKGKAYFGDDKTGSTFSNYGNEIDVYPLSDILLEDTTFIKMDMEGSETNTIHGLKSFLEKKEKKGNISLAISIYHYPDELYSIPLLILKYAPSAKIYIRHHTKNQSETVCYAII